MDPAPLLNSIAKEVQVIDPNIVVSTSGTLEGSLKEFYRGPQFELVTFGSFALIGFLLMLIGISSVMVYTVSLRTHEIGIRMSLGALPTDILGMVVTLGLRLITLGTAIGLLLSYASSRLLASEISGISVTDPWTFAAVAVAVIIVGLFASYLPARRAARVDPIIALRRE